MKEITYFHLLFVHCLMVEDLLAMVYNQCNLELLLPAFYLESIIYYN